jgi:hypothetical protein
MSFHLSAENVRIEENHILVALLCNADGELKDASIDLDQFIGNNEGALRFLVHGRILHLMLQPGSFQWGGENFSISAEDVQFTIEGDGEVPVLRARLPNSAGELFDADINLSERIVNDNGSFTFV